MRSGWYQEASGSRRWWGPETGWTQDVLTSSGTPSVDPGPSPHTTLPHGTPMTGNTVPDPTLGGLIPVVFLPCARPFGPEDSDVELESFETGDGAALLVFSSLEALVEGCGENQPWITIPLNCLAELRRRCGGEPTVVWDAVLPTSKRHRPAPNTRPDPRHWLNPTPRPETF